MSGVVVKRHVPVLDEHTVTDENGNVVVRIDEEKLRRIARNSNKRVLETGDLIPIVIGHTRDNLPEEKQPQIVGYASNFDVGPLFKSGRKALRCTMRFFRKYLDKVKKHPRRSVELWLRRWEVDPISLLGATAPERNLGLLRFRRGLSASIPVVFRYKRGGQMPANKELVEEVLAAIQQTDLWKRLEHLADRMEGQEDGAEGDLGGGPGDDDGAMPGGEEEELDDLAPGEDEEDMGQDLGQIGALGGDDEDEEVPLDEEPRRRYNAGCASGTSTHMPGMNGRRRLASQGRPLRTTRSGADSMRIRMARMEAALRQRDLENEQMRLRFARVSRERDLIQLESEGYVFDRDEELDFVTPLPERTYRQHIQRIRKCYQRAPVGTSDIEPRHYRNGIPAGVTGAGTSREQMERVKEYASSRGISYAQAKQELEGQGGDGRVF